MNNLNKNSETQLTFNQKQAIAQSILDTVINQGGSTLFFTMQNVLRVNFLKHGINNFIDLESLYNLNTYEDSLDVCVCFCKLFKTTMTDIMSSHGGTLDYTLNDKNYRVRYVCNSSYPNGFSITVLIN